jgi:hypothetical protein
MQTKYLLTGGGMYASYWLAGWECTVHMVNMLPVFIVTLVYLDTVDIAE